MPNQRELQQHVVDPTCHLMNAMQGLREAYLQYLTTVYKDTCQGRFFDLVSLFAI